jgi:hypothetical protein
VKDPDNFDAVFLNVVENSMLPNSQPEGRLLLSTQPSDRAARNSLGFAAAD